MAKSKVDYWLTKDGLTLLTGWARDGLTNEQIAHNMGIVTSTLMVYKEKHSTISDALKKGKEVVDLEVENALLKRAMGYRYTEVTSERKLDPQTGEYALIPTKTVIKDVPPEVAAAFIWLKNRMPHKWRDKVMDIAGKQNNGLADAITQAVKEVGANDLSNIFREAVGSNDVVEDTDDQPEL